MTAQFMEQPAEWDRADWLEWRRAGCGGSDVAAICELSTFGSPTSVYYDKLGLSADEPENEAMLFGRVLEPVIAEQFTVRTDLHVVAPQILVFDEDHPWRRATLDGLVSEAHNVPSSWWAVEDILGTFEAKTTGDRTWDDESLIPDRVKLQCCWQMGIAEFERCWLAVLHQGRRLAVLELEFDPVAFAKLAEIVDRFYCDHVLANVPPPPDSNPATTAALKSAWNERADGENMEFDDELIAVAEEWLRAKRAVDHAKTWQAGAENVLRAALREHTYGTWGDDEVISWKPQKVAGRLDEKALREAEPDVYAKFKKPDGTTRVLRPTKALRALAEGVDA